MSLLDNFPHRCTIQYRVRTKGTLGGSSDAPVVEQTDVPCWEQNASHREVTDYEKDGISVTHKTYFVSNPNITRRHEIVMTERDGVSVAEDPKEVRSDARPDASAGLGVVWKVMTEDMARAKT
jgi:hypothetical protein